MHFVDRHREKIRQSPMSSRLLWACLLLVVLLVLTFGAALFLFASLHNTKKDISRSLQIQFSVFQNDMERYFDQLAVMGVNLSEDMSAEVDKELALRQMSFAQLNDSPEVLNALEEEMIEPLCRRLRQTGCSGAFVLLDATINTRMEGAEHSRAGLYVQKSGADTPTVPLLLYRGSAEVGKTHSVMPHRKWRMEFQTDQFPDYDRWMTPGSAPLYQSYTLTERFELPGTSEEVQLFLLPLRGRDGTMYGLCGFEISESYFKQNFAQPTGFDRLSCLLAPAGDGLAADAALSSGTTGGYYHAPPEHAGAAQHGRRADPVDRPRQRLCGHLPAVPPEREPVLPAGGVHSHGRLPETGLFRQSADAAHRPVHRLFRSVLLHELPPAHPLACVPAVRGGPAGIPAADGRAAAGTPADAD